MSPVVTRDLAPGTTCGVYRLVARAPGRPLGWATLTLAGPGEAFANVCLEATVPTAERRRFLAAVVDVVTRLGARHLLAVVSTQDEPLVAGLGPSCRVVTSTALGPTSLVRVALAAETHGGGLDLGSGLACDIRVERLPSAAGGRLRATRPSGRRTTPRSRLAASYGET